MALRSGSCRVFSVASCLYFCKSITFSSVFPVFMTDSKSDKLAGQKKDIFFLSGASISTPVEVQTPKYTKTDLIKILKIFSKTKSQTQLEVSYEQPLKAKLFDVYFGKLYIDCYHSCQQYKDYFNTADATRSNRTLFAASFF